MRTILVGATATHTSIPDATHTAAALGNSGVIIVSSPAMIAFLEQTCHLALKPFLDPGEVALGIRFDLHHIGAAVLEQPVQTQAQVTYVQERQVVMDVEAEQNEQRLMYGSIHYRIINLARFLARHGLADPAVGNVVDSSPDPVE